MSEIYNAGNTQVHFSKLGGFSPIPKTFISLHILLLQDTALLKAPAKTHTGGGKNDWTRQMVCLWMLKRILRELSSMT